MNKQDNLDRIRIVLVGTQDGANIGSVCRAMKTMGLTRLVLVTEREYAENRVKSLAIHAADLYENREQYTSLAEALKKSVLSIAATRRRGKFRKATCVNPEQLAEQLSGIGEGDISIVFGRESDGLTDEEVACCGEVVTIPSSEKFPSLNLSQAVQVITYSLFSHLHESDVKLTPVTKAKLDGGVEQVVAVMDKVGFFKMPDEKLWTQRFIHDIFERAQMSEEELKRMTKLFVKMTTIAKYKSN